VKSERKRKEKEVNVCVLCDEKEKSESIVREKEQNYTLLRRSSRIFIRSTYLCYIYFTSLSNTTFLPFFLVIGHLSFLIEFNLYFLYS